jgi:hypothetical protein
MENTNNDQNIDELVDQLKNIPITTSNIVISSEPLSNENLNDYIIKNAALVIQNSIESINVVKNQVEQSVDADTILAYSDLIKASTHALEVVNKINAQNKKIKANKEIKEMEKQMQLDAGKHPTNVNNILIATREDVFKRIMTELNNEKAIDIKVTEIPTKELVSSEVVS